jgi:hypothetical protein
MAPGLDVSTMYLPPRGDSLIAKLGALTVFVGATVASGLQPANKLADDSARNVVLRFIAMAEEGVRRKSEVQ